MHASIRAALAAGVTVLTGSALAIAPTVQPLSAPPTRITAPISFTAGSAGIPAATDAQLLTTLAAFVPPPASGRSASEGAPAVTIEQPAGVDDPAQQATADDPVVLNAASDVIDTVYAFTRYWANYVSLELGPWLINWIPFGYLISDQIQIWYPNFVLPVVDSFVYDFLDPVVNDPLNLAVWAQGIGDIIDAAVNGVVNGVSAEIQYILDFGWFPIPLPPLPSFPIPGAASADAEVDGADVESADVQLAAVEDSGAGVEDPGEDAGEDISAPAEAPLDEDSDARVSQKPAEEVEEVLEAPAEEAPAEEAAEDAPTEETADDQTTDDQTTDTGGDASTDTD